MKMIKGLKGYHANDCDHSNQFTVTGSGLID